MQLRANQALASTWGMDVRCTSSVLTQTPTTARVARVLSGHHRLGSSDLYMDAAGDHGWFRLIALNCQTERLGPFAEGRGMYTSDGGEAERPMIGCYAPIES